MRDGARKLCFIVVRTWSEEIQNNNGNSKYICVLWSHVLYQTKNTWEVLNNKLFCIRQKFETELQNF